jgi:hypothetical protein
MTLGTKTLLFGVHQVFIHPLLVTVAWVKLYRSFPSWREMFCIVIHDWGYWGKPDLKNADGDAHPELGAKIAGRVLGPEWSDFILGHSSFYMVRKGVKQSKLFGPDKYWHCMIPLWLYKMLSVPSGEFKHYRELKHARQVADQEESDAEWWAKLQKVCDDKVAGTFEIDRRKLAQ